MLTSFGLFGLIVSSVLANWAYSLNPSLALITIPLSIAAGIAAAVLILFMALWLEIQKRFPTADTIRVCTSILTAEGFYDIMPEKTAFLPWIGVEAPCEHNGDIYIWASGSGCNFIPREAFDDLAIARQFHKDAFSLYKDAVGLL